MRIVIAGGSGLLGSALTEYLVGAGHDVVILSRRAHRTPRSRGRQVEWTPDGRSGPWAGEVDGADAVVNLAGTALAETRWTPARKALIRSSRIDSTRSLGAAVQAAARPPAVFVQGSAVGYYGSSLSDTEYDERSPAGSGFLATLAAEWEAASRPVADAACRLVFVRTGVVLSPDGGAVPPMARPFRFFVGGPVGSGRQ
jgi:uncharacterized protein (TIGR01777 family)